jgi:hypothetical protein
MIFFRKQSPVRDYILVENTSKQAKRPVRDEISVERTSHWCTKRPVRDEISVEKRPIGARNVPLGTKYR